jgi:hypothetical protein
MAGASLEIWSFLNTRSALVGREVALRTLPIARPGMLSLRDFSTAARSCRLWTVAGQLAPSANAPETEIWRRCFIAASSSCTI